MPLGTVMTSFAAPSTYPSGLTFDGKNLWLCDGNANLVYQLTRSGVVVSSFSVNPPIIGPEGLTFDGKNLWIGDQTNINIFQYQRNGVLIDSFATGSRPRGIIFDKKNLWVLTDATAELRNRGGVLINALAKPEVATQDATFDGKNLYMIGYTNNRLYVVARDGTVINFVSIAAIDAIPMGLTFDGQYLWFCGRATNRIYMLTRS